MKVDCFKALYKNLAAIVFVLLVLTAFPAMNVIKADEGVPADSAEKVKPLKVGDTAPKVTLTSEEGNPFDLNAQIAKKPTVLIFYRGRW